LISLLANGAEAALASQAVTDGADPTATLALTVDQDAFLIRISDNRAGVLEYCE